MTEPLESRRSSSGPTLSDGERSVLVRAAESGNSGCPTPSGETGADTVAALTERGLLVWEQTSPFVATMWATHAGMEALNA